MSNIKFSEQAITKCSLSISDRYSVDLSLNNKYKIPCDDCFFNKSGWI